MAKNYTITSNANPGLPATPGLQGTKGLSGVTTERPSAKLLGTTLQGAAKKPLPLGGNVAKKMDFPKSFEDPASDLYL